MTKEIDWNINAEYRDKYMENNMYKLDKMLNYIIYRYFQNDNVANSFYDKGVEIFEEIIVPSYREDLGDFHKFAQNSLVRKLLEFRTYNNRTKRHPHIISNNGEVRNIYLERFQDIVNEDGKEVTKSDLIESSFNTETEVITKDDDEFESINEYLSHLSKKQRKVAVLFAEGYDKKRVMELAGITQSELNDIMLALKASRNTKYLHY